MLVDLYVNSFLYIRISRFWLFSAEIGFCFGPDSDCALVGSRKNFLINQVFMMVSGLPIQTWPDAHLRSKYKNCGLKRLTDRIPKTLFRFIGLFIDGLWPKQLKRSKSALYFSTKLAVSRAQGGRLSWRTCLRRAVRQHEEGVRTWHLLRLQTIDRYIRNLSEEAVK